MPRLKNSIKYLLHNLFGFRNYLFLFSIFKIVTLRWDRKENDFFRFMDLIKSEGIILDIGANIGIMAVHLARKQRTSTVYCFEPVPENISALTRIVSFFGVKNVRIREHALGNSAGEIEMVIPVIGSVKMQGLSHVLHSSIRENNEGKKFKVPVQRLDDIHEIVHGKQPVTAVKIDVENFEAFVFEGAVELLKKHRPVIYCELWDNDNRNHCFELLRKLGYAICVNEKGALVPFDAGRHHTQNFFFIP